MRATVAVPTLATTRSYGEGQGMFSLTRIIGMVPLGALQPDRIDIVGSFACPATTAGVPIELRLVGPGLPTTVFTATTSTGAPGTPPVGSVEVIVPWTGWRCGEKVEFEVRGQCNGQWTPWQPLAGQIDCVCPRIANVQASYGMCSGMPLRQSVTITATVMMSPGGGTTPFTCDFGDGAVVTQQVTPPTLPNVQQTLTFQHDYAPGTYSVCLRSGECPPICEVVRPSCGACCDEVTLTMVSQPVPCLPVGGGAATVQFSAQLSPGGCTGPFEWKVTDLGTNAVLLPFTAGGPTFSHAFGAPGTYKVNVRVQQDGDCDDPVLTDSITFSVGACSPCAVSVSGPQQTACTDGAPTAALTYTATTTGNFAGPFTWEVRKLPAMQPLVQSTGGNAFSFAFPGPGTYEINVSIQTQGCTNPTASSSVSVVVPRCTPPACPPGQHLDANGNCVPDTPPACPPGQHRDANGVCVPDTPPTCPPGQMLDASGKCIQDHRISCDALLWIALILIAISGVLAVVGCVLSNAYPVAGAVLGIIALALLVIGALLFLLWWAICRLYTACSVIIAALNFMGVMIAVFAVVGAILVFIAKFGGRPDLWLCVGASFFQSAIWGLLLWILYRIAVAVNCVTENPNGPPPPTPPSSSSSSGLSSTGQRPNAAGPMAGRSMSVASPKGLGDYVQSAAKAMGFQPCAACHERARRLNALAGPR